MCAHQPIFFRIIDVEYNSALWKIVREILHELEKCCDSHAVIRCTKCRGDRVEMGREEDCFKIGLLPVNFNQDVIPLKVYASSGIPRCIALKIVNYVYVIVKLYYFREAGNDMRANHIVCMGIIGMRAASNLLKSLNAGYIVLPCKTHNLEITNSCCQVEAKLPG